MTKTEKQRRDVLRIERRRPFPLLPRLALTLCSTYGSKPWVFISAFPSAGLRRRRSLNGTTLSNPDWGISKRNDLVKPRLGQCLQIIAFQSEKKPPYFLLNA